MNCPSCNGATRVYDTRKSPQRITRRRKCKECGHRFATIELSRTELDNLCDLAGRFEKFMDAINVLRLWGEIDILCGWVGRFQRFLDAFNALELGGKS